MLCLRVNMKAGILQALGETELGRPAQVNAALAANDRIKYYLSLLQMGMTRADHPEQPASSLRRERLACGIDQPELDDVVGSTRKEGGAYRIPGCAKILGSVTQDLRVMAEPTCGAGSSSQKGSATFIRRLETLVANLKMPKDDVIQGEAIREITRAGGKEDSLHQFVMDLHKRLNALQAEMAEERLDGAAVYKIEDADRPLIAAFMAGVNRTAPLKFDHPGLDTTATRAGSKLVIQNDVGTTDAHVIVIHVEGAMVQVTYTDVHPERAQFFRDMLKKYPVAWSGDREGRLPSNCPENAAGLEDKSQETGFTMLSGTFTARDHAEIEQYLSFLGSRLVFLIDWNRARKQLRGFLRNAERTAVLSWAAEAEVGHRAFIELGGAHIINQAIEKVSGSALHFGDRLCDVLGNAAALEFVHFVFVAARDGLKEHQSAGLIQDRICAELQAHFASEEQRLWQVAGEHAGLIFELATAVQKGVRAIACGEDGENFDKLVKHARGLEHDADQQVVIAREAVRKRPEYTALFRVVEDADDAADELEEVAFLLGLLHETRPTAAKRAKPQEEPLEALSALSSLLLEAAQEWVKALGHAAHVKKSGQQQDAEDFLLACDRLLKLEHQADDAERALTYASVQHARNFRQLHLYSEIGGSLEAAADSLKRAALVSRDHLFSSVLGA